MNRVMIVDSDLIQMNSLRSALSDEYLILTSNRGTKAMDLFKAFQPNAVILDPSTHGLDGREFIKKIRNIPFRKNILILALTRFTTLKNIEESFTLGVDLILSKPCSADRVKSKLAGHFRKHANPSPLELALV